MQLMREEPPPALALKFAPLHHLPARSWPFADDACDAVCGALADLAAASAAAVPRISVTMPFRSPPDTLRRSPFASNE